MDFFEIFCFEISDKVMHITPALAIKAADGDFGYIPLPGKKPMLAIHYSYEDQRKLATTRNMLEKIVAEIVSFFEFFVIFLKFLLKF